MITNCPTCRTQFKAKMMTVGKPPNRRQQRQRYCSKKCSSIAYSKTGFIAREIKSLSSIGANYPNKNKNKRRYINKKHTEALRYCCRDCGCMINHTSPQFCRQYCDSCSAKRIKKQRSASRKQYRIKYGKIKSHKRRAERFGVDYELINRVKVFDMYGWCCANCGKKTPRDLMRTYDNPDAPTLDHIVPISKGGAHLYSNVQLLCRQCNVNKGNDNVQLC